jgi:hypothetical protein
MDSTVGKGEGRKTIKWAVTQNGLEPQAFYTHYGQDPKKRISAGYIDLPPPSCAVHLKMTQTVINLLQKRLSAPPRFVAAAELPTRDKESRLCDNNAAKHIY